MSVIRPATAEIVGCALQHHYLSACRKREIGIFRLDDDHFGIASHRSDPHRVRIAPHRPLPLDFRGARSIGTLLLLLTRAFGGLQNEANLLGRATPPRSEASFKIHRARRAVIHGSGLGALCIRLRRT
jgi:hypothetical protein